MHDTPCTSTLDCKMDQLKALLSAAIDLTCPSSVPDMATVRGVLYARAGRGAGRWCNR